MLLPAFPETCRKHIKMRTALVVPLLLNATPNVGSNSKFVMWQNVLGSVPKKKKTSMSYCCQIFTSRAAHSLKCGRPTNKPNNVQKKKSYMLLKSDVSKNTFSVSQILKAPLKAKTPYFPSLRFPLTNPTKL